MSGRKIADPATAKRLFEEGLSNNEISEIMGVSLTTVKRYVRNGVDERDRRALALDRLGEQAHGLALGCDMIVNDLPAAPNRYDVELWLSELNRVVKSARYLRQQLREKLNDG